MNSYERLTVVLNESEMQQLRQAARADLRRPSDQARYLLRLGLGLAAVANEVQKHNHAVHTLAGNDGVIAAA